MGLVQRLAARKHLKVLRNAKSASEPDLREAADRLLESGPSLLPSVLEIVVAGTTHPILRELLMAWLSDETLSEFVDAIGSAKGATLTWIEDILAEATTYDPKALFPALESAGPRRANIERVLRARAASLGLQELKALLGDTPPRDLIRLILDILDEKKDSRSIPIVSPLLRSKDTWVRVRALRFLADQGEESAVDPILPCLEFPEPAVRREAVKALGAIGSNRPLVQLCHTLRDSDLKVSSAAIEALVAINDPGAVAHLIDVLKDESEYARRGAVEVLNQVATPEAIQDLVQALQDEDWWVRVRAADALGALGGDRVVDAILKLVKSDDVFVRRYAIEIFNSIPSDKSVPALIDALSDTDWWVRERAIDALGKTQDARAVEPLMMQLRANADVANLVLPALGKIGDRTALLAVSQCLQSGDAKISEIAKTTLKEIAQEASEAEVRKEAARLLSDDGNQTEWGQRKAGSLLDDPSMSGERDGSVAFAAPDQTMLKQRPDFVAGPQVPVAKQGGSPADSGSIDPSNKTQIVPPTQMPTDGRSGFIPTPDFPGGADGSGAGPISGHDSGANFGAGGDATIIGPASGQMRPPTSGVQPRSLLEYCDLQTGSRLMDRYRVVRKIGEGGFGYVYLVEDDSIGEQVILKILSPQISMDDSMIKRFVHELKYNRRIVHPNVIRLYDFMELNPGHAISMEYFPSRDWGTVLHESGRMDASRVVPLTTQICHGLKAAHDAGIVHRDIKPPNILIDDNDRVKIVDFGLAAASDSKHSRVTKSGILVGTPQYMAPEQIRGTDIDARTDIYAVGAMLFEALVGHPPFESENPVNVLMMHVSDPVPDIRELVPDIPPMLEDIITRSLAKDPADRPQTIDDIIAHFESEAA